jgi:hypothetical protein
MATVAPQDPREALLTKLRLQAEMSQKYGQRVANLTQVDLRPHPAAQSGAFSSAPNSESDASDEDNDEQPRLKRHSHHQGVYDGSRALQLHSELTARIRLTQAQSAKFATESATSRMLPVEVVTLVPKPDAIQSLGTLASTREGGGAMYEDILSFWGIWFVVAAVVRFQRPLRRKRVMDVQLRLAKNKETVRLQLEQLKNAGLAHDTRRTARRLLQDTLHESEAAATRGRGGTRTPRGPSLSSSPGGSALPSPHRPSTQHSEKRPNYSTVSASSQRSVLSLTPLKDPARAQGAIGHPTRSKSFEDKREQRDLRKTALNIARGTSYCGSLAKTLTQHTHTANPAELARFMASALQGPKPPATADSTRTRPPTRDGNDRVSTSDADRPRGVLSPPQSDVLLTSGHQLVAEGDSIPALARSVDTPASTVRLGSASRSHPFSDTRGVWAPLERNRQPRGAPTPADVAPMGLSTSTPHGGVAMHESVVRRFCEQQRRNGSAGVLSANHVITLDETQFPYTPLPKLSAASARAYPPPTPRPPPSKGRRERGAQTDVERTFMRRVDTNTFHEDMCHRLQHAEQWRQRDFDLKKQFLQYYSHKQPAGEHGTVHQLVRDMGQYVDAKRTQDARMERHALRVAWFHNFYEAIVERASWDELEPLLMAMEEQVMNAFSQLEVDDFRRLFEEAQRREILRLPSVQFFLCHVAAAYQVPYITFRELLELSHTPYILQGNGESFYTTVEVK